MTISLRKATEADAPPLSRICLLTCNAGKSGEGLYDHPELPGLVYALPYVKLPPTYGFVMVVDETKEVVGYILGATDTREFERIATEEWWPPLKLKYPIEGPNKIQGKAADEQYAKLIHNMYIADEPCIKFSPAHLHIDILDEYQRKGWGKKLIARAVEHLRDEIGLNSVWLGMDPRNMDARKFYEKLGFADIPGAPANVVGLSFENWKG